MRKQLSSKSKRENARGSKSKNAFDSSMTHKPKNKEGLFSNSISQSLNALSNSKNKSNHKRQSKGNAIVNSLLTKILISLIQDKYHPALGLVKRIIN